MISTSDSIQRAVRYVLLMSAATAAAATPAQAQEGDTIQEVVVTGSHIPQPNLPTTSPVIQITAEDVITQGVTKIEDLLNQLPQAFGAQNATLANGSNGHCHRQSPRIGLIPAWTSDRARKRARPGRKSGGHRNSGHAVIDTADQLRSD